MTGTEQEQAVAEEPAAVEPAVPTANAVTKGGGGAVPERLSRKTVISVVCAALVGAGILLAPLPGASAWGHRVLAIIGVALVLWIAEALNIAVTSLLVVALLAIFGPGASDQATRNALYGFQLSAPYFLLGTLVLAAATVQSGLAGRLARLLVAGTGRSAKRLYAQTILLIPPSAIVVPSGTTRNAILMPAYEHVFGRFGLERGDELPRAISLALGTLTVVASTAVLTGGVAPITTAFLLGGFSWGTWFLYMAVPNYAIIALSGLLYFLWLRPSLPHRPPSATATPPPDSWTAPEIRAAIIIGSMTALWLGDFLTGWDPLIPALLGAVLLLSPGIGVLTWRDFELTGPWGIFFVTATSLSIAHALETSGAAAWLAAELVKHVPLGQLPFWLLLLVMILVVLVVNVILPNRSGALGILIPLLSSVATRVGLNPLPVGLMIGILVQTTTFYPIQNAAALVVYRSRLFAPFDFFRAGLILFGVSIVAIFLVALPWWSFVGIPIQP